MTDKLENIKREIKPVRPAVLLFTAALAIIFTFTLNLYTLPLLVLIGGAFILRGLRGGLDSNILIASLFALLVIAAPIFREFKLEQKKIQKLSSKDGVWRGKIIIPAAAASAK
ncbi:MAG: hypothetical protein GX834_01930, partial [Clostridiaceae bacterium]|nr:hypothetical protein [Clostridiaceae bacterium]